MGQPYCILDVLGDVLDDGELRFVEAAKTLEAARRRIRALGESHPGEFVIYDQQTGERVFVKVGVERAVAPLLPRLLEAVQGEGIFARTNEPFGGAKRRSDVCLPKNPAIVAPVSCF